MNADSVAFMQLLSYKITGHPSLAGTANNLSAGFAEVTHENEMNEIFSYVTYKREELWEEMRNASALEVSKYFLTVWGLNCFGRSEIPI